MLGRLNICSKEAWVRQYDHEVQGMSVVKPFVGRHNDGPSDAAVLRPLFDSHTGPRGRQRHLPTLRRSSIPIIWRPAPSMKRCAMSSRSVGASGASPAWTISAGPTPSQSPTNPDAEYKLAQLVRANQALYDYCRAYDLPCISGKDSMKNDYRVGDTKISIPPTLLFSVLGVIDDVTKVVTMDAKHPGDVVYVLGMTRQSWAALNIMPCWDIWGVVCHRLTPRPPGGSMRRCQRPWPRVWWPPAMIVQMAVWGSRWRRRPSLVASAWRWTCVWFQGPSDLRDDVDLFSESPSRFVVTVQPEQVAAFEAHLTRVAMGGRWACHWRHLSCRWSGARGR